MFNVVTVTEFGGACPTQLEGRLDDGRHVYARYRHGYLTIGIGADPCAAVENSIAGGFECALGGPFDGYLSYGALIDATAGHFTWPPGV